MYLFLLTLWTILAITFQSALAEDPAPTSGFINQPSLLIANAPGGNKIGEVYLNTPVIIQKKEGTWAKVTIDAWVRVSGIGEKLPEPSSPANQPDAMLKITHYSVKKVSEKLPAPRVYLTIALKNSKPDKIQSWEGLIVAQDIKTKEVLFRERVSDEKPIAAGATQDVIFYWESTEEPYDHLVSANPASVSLELYQVQTK